MTNHRFSAAAWRRIASATLTAAGLGIGGTAAGMESER